MFDWPCNWSLCRRFISGACNGVMISEKVGFTFSHFISARFLVPVKEELDYKEEIDSAVYLPLSRTVDSQR